MLYVPPQEFESDVTYQYYSWWKETISPSSYPEIDIETHEKDIEMKEEVTGPLQKKQRLIDLNSKPSNLNKEANLSVAGGEEIIYGMLHGCKNTEHKSLGENFYNSFFFILFYIFLCKLAMIT